MLSKFRLSMIALMLLSSCIFSSNPPPPPDVQITETENNIIVITETIRINNCGGKADSEQIAERSFSMNIEGFVDVNIGTIVEGSVGTKYGQYTSISKTHKLIAPPGTHMEFILEWTEQTWRGNVVSNGQLGSYNIHAPIGVEQISARDLDDCPISTTEVIQPIATGQVDSTVLTPAPSGVGCNCKDETCNGVHVNAGTTIPVSSILQGEDNKLYVYLVAGDASVAGMLWTYVDSTGQPAGQSCIEAQYSFFSESERIIISDSTPNSNPLPALFCPMMVIEGTVGGLLIPQTKTWLELGNTIQEPQSTNLNELCSRNSDNLVQVWIGYWSSDMGYLNFRGTMTPNEAVSLVAENPNQPVLIVPWGK